MKREASIKIVPYSPRWPSLFEAERIILTSVFPKAAFRIERVGSTAVPGLSAKPIIDVLVGAYSLAEIEARIPAMKALDIYTCQSTRPYFRYDASLPNLRLLRDGSRPRGGEG
jgi:GrpB-like predicted nucleotidyltransferase (UPF0157 family)